MFNLGFSEVIVIVVVALLVLGPEKLPEVARTLGKVIGDLKRTLDDVKREIAAPVSEFKREVEETRRDLTTTPLNLEKEETSQTPAPEDKGE